MKKWELGSSCQTIAASLLTLPQSIVRGSGKEGKQAQEIPAGMPTGSVRDIAGQRIGATVQGQQQRPLDAQARPHELEKTLRAFAGASLRRHRTRSALSFTVSTFSCRGEDSRTASKATSAAGKNPWSNRLRARRRVLGGGWVPTKRPESAYGTFSPLGLQPQPVLLASTVNCWKLVSFWPLHAQTSHVVPSPPSEHVGHRRQNQCLPQRKPFALCVEVGRFARVSRSSCATI